MSVTLIAEKAGVSIATVSRVLNKSRPVHPDIAERVMQAVSDLQLSPQRMRRRAKISTKPLTVAIVSLGNNRNWFEVPVMANMIANLTRAAETRDVGVLIAEMNNPMEISPALRRQDVDGAIVFVDRYLSSKDLEPLRNHLPIVRVMGGHLSPIEIEHVTTDNCAVGYLAGNYLIEQGLTELAFISTAPHWEITQLRAHGFFAVTQAAGLSPALYLENSSRPPMAIYGSRAMQDTELKTLIPRMLSARKGRLGVFVSRDEEAVLVYQLLREARVEIGKDVVVVSCDNEAVRLSTLHPRPVSIDLGAPQIAQLAFDALTRRIQNPKTAATRTLVYPKLARDVQE